MRERPKRRVRLGVVAFLAVPSLVACLASPSEPNRSVTATPLDRPNILLVLTDDQRPTELLDVMPETTRIFGRRGVTFPNAYATTPVCCPSRASILTGRYAHNHGVLRNGKGSIDGFDQDDTLEYHLQQAGYRTAVFGKLINDWPMAVSPSYFDRWAIFRGGKALGFYDGIWNVNGDKRTVSKYSTTYIQNWALRFLEESESDDDRPWLMLLFVYPPHGPAIPHERDVRAPVPKWPPNPAVTNEDLRGKPPIVRDAPPVTPEELRRIQRRQARSLMSADRMVARVFRSMVTKDEASSTLAFFTSDNGYLWGEHTLTRKFAPYMQSIKIPMMVRWPGVLGRGEVDDRIVANIDLFPTAMAAAGLPVTPGPETPATVPTPDGRSLLDPRERDRLLIEQWAGGPGNVFPNWASLVTPTEQYIEYYRLDETSVTFKEYYDLSNDPWQLVNLLWSDPGSHKERAAELATQLEIDRSCEGSACP